MDKPEYYFVQSLCRDGGHEYTDSFCVVADYELNDEQFEQAVLDWNFGGVEWDDDRGEWVRWDKIFEHLYRRSNHQRRTRCNEKIYLFFSHFDNTQKCNWECH